MDIIDKNPHIKSIDFLRHGTIPPENVKFHLLKSNRECEVTDSGRNPPKTLTKFLDQSTNANLLVIAHDEIVGHQTMIPIGRLYEEIDAYLSNSPNFKLVEELSDYSGKKVSFFERL